MAASETAGVVARSNWNQVDWRDERVHAVESCGREWIADGSERELDRG